MNWKTNTGAIVVAIGGGLIGIADVCPVPEWIPWLKFIGTFFTLAGGGLTAIGLGHKIDKAKKALLGTGDGTK